MRLPIPPPRHKLNLTHAENLTRETVFESPPRIPGSVNSGSQVDTMYPRGHIGGHGTESNHPESYENAQTLNIIIGGS